MAINFAVQSANQAVAAGPFDQVISLLATFGFFRVVLPLLLVFVIFYAIILKTNVFGDPMTAPWIKPVAAVIGLIAGFLTVAYTPVVNALATVLPQASFLLVIVVLIIMTLGMLGVPTTYDKDRGMNKLIMIIAIIVVIIFVTMVGVAAPGVPILHGFAQFMMGNFMLPDLSADAMSFLIAIALMLAVVGGVIYAITKTK